MYKNPLTKSQKADNYSETVCIQIIKGLMRRCGELDMQHKDFAAMIEVQPNTWERWRSLARHDTRKFDPKRPDCNMIFRAAYLANLKIDLNVS